MCFSATASFAAAGGLFVIGAATLSLRPSPRLIMLAATPLLFAAHQAVEGLVWRGVHDGAVAQSLIKVWVFVAEVFWPTFTPLAVLILTRGRRRRQALAALLATGLIVSAYFLNVLVQNDYAVSVVRGSLRYQPEAPVSHNLPGLYLLSTVAPLLIARERFVLLFGLAVLLGAIVTELFFSYAGPSVWCFFAAIASACAFLAVRDEKSSRRPRLAPTPGL